MARFRIEPDTDSGSILDRVLEAYGFTQKLQLADHLGIASSSMSNRYKRGGYPADIMIKCVAETGVNLEWLATGKGPMYDDGKLDTLTMRRKKLIDGQLFDAGYLMFDKTMILPPKPELINPFSLVDESNQYIIEQEFTDVFDGEWLLDIEGKISIRTLNRIPIKKVRVSGVGMAFDCSIDEITVLGRVVLSIE